ncbi:MAG: AsmA family protein [Proteobacteria bacterium]|jgi:AsmA protein|nr:AsmA family protein [Pseudomonadota bacterium]
MKKLFKLLGWLVSTLFVLVLLAIVILPNLFDPNDYRDELVSLVKEKTGRDLTLDGDLSLSVFPWLGVSTGAVSFSQPAGIDAPDMLSVEAVDLRVKLLPLLQSKVEVATIILSEPQLHIVVSESGQSSLSGFSGEHVSEQESTEDAAGAAVALAVAGVELTNGHLIYDDQQAGQRYELSGLQVVTGNLLGSSLEDILIEGVFIDSTQADPVEFKVQGQGAIDVNRYFLTMADFDVNVVQGAVSADLVIGGLKFAQQTGQAELTEVTAFVDVLPQSIEFRLASATLDLGAQVLEVPELAVIIGDTRFTASASGQKIIDAPVFSGNLNAASFNLQTLLSDLAVDYQTTDPEAMRAVALSADYQATMDSVALTNLLVQLDQTKLEGSFSAENFAAPQLAFELDMNAINIDRYMSPAVEQEQEPAALALVVPLAALRGAHANGTFNASSMTAGGMKVGDIDVDVETVGNTMIITYNAALYGGALRGEIQYLDHGAEAQMIVNQGVYDVDLGALLSDIEVTDRLSGSGTLDIDLTITETATGQTNKGTVGVLARDGALKGVDVKAIIDKVADVYASIKGGESGAGGDVEASSESSDETRFAELSGTFAINDQLLTNDDFLMKAPLFRVQGEGQIDLEKESLNYLTTLAVVATSEGQDGEDRSDLAGLDIPVRFSGDLTAPSYRIDFGELLKQLARQTVAEKKDELKEGLQEKLGEEAGNLLKGLFN